MLFCEFWEISKNSFFTEHFLATASASLTFIIWNTSIKNGTFLAKTCIMEIWNLEQIYGSSLKFNELQLMIKYNQNSICQLYTGAVAIINFIAFYTSKIEIA